MPTPRLRRACCAAGALTASLVLAVGVVNQAAYGVPKKPELSMAAEIARASRVMPLPAGTTTWTPNFGVSGPLWGGGRHTGQDFGAPSGTPILAAAKGIVAFTGNAGPYGNMTRITHPDGVETWYAHQSAIYVHAGQSVQAGQMIGAVGSTGNSIGPHLHFEVRVGGQPADPNPWLQGAAAVPAEGIAGAKFDPALADELRGQIADAEDTLNRATRDAAEAAGAQLVVDKKLALMQARVDAAKRTLDEYAREVYKSGMDPQFLLQAEALSSASMSEYTDRQTLLQYANQAQDFRVSQALLLLADARGLHDESATLAQKAKDVLDAAKLKMADLQTRLDASTGVWQAGGQFTGEVPAGGSAAASRAVKFALAQLGAPYSAKTATGPSYSWNGLAYRAWHEAGLGWPVHTGNSQALNTKWVVPVERGKEMPGDLVFFRFDNGSDLKGRIDHVGIVVDPAKGVFIHASSSKTGVELNNYKTTSYYQTPAMFGRVVVSDAATDSTKNKKPTKDKKPTKADKPARSD
ncbi:MAG: peptidoglycan DD-metalloendopeptidase family protein [Actinomycetes bacterium]